MAQLACYCQSLADLNLAIDKKMKCYLFCLTCLRPLLPPVSLILLTSPAELLSLSRLVYMKPFLSSHSTTLILCLILFILMSIPLLFFPLL